MTLRKLKNLQKILEIRGYDLSNKTLEEFLKLAQIEEVVSCK
jgi:hypothetical protein